MNASNVVLRARGLSKEFKQATSRIRVLSGLELEVREGESVAILGRSGSGKSTLLSLLTGLDRPSEGLIEIAGQNLLALNEAELSRFRAKQVGIVFQQFHLMSHLTALENIALPLDLAGVGPAEARLRALEMIEKVGLLDRQGHFPQQLSGGEKQRVAIARASIVRPHLLFADEPTGSLDEDTGAVVLDLLFRLVKEANTSLILVTHSQELAARCDTRYVLNQFKLTRTNSGASVSTVGTST